MAMIHHTERLTRFSCLVLFCICIGIAGCKKVEETPAAAAEARQAPNPGNTDRPGTASAHDTTTAQQDEAPQSARVTMDIWRPLLDEAGRAELDVNGVLVDFGTLDVYKYTRGGWRTGWGANEVSQGVTFTPAIEASGIVDVPPTQRPIQRVVTQIRSRCDGQKVSVRLGKTRLGEVELGAEWQTLDLPVPAEHYPQPDADSESDAGSESRADSKSAPHADEQLTFVFRKTCSSGAGQVDWLWFATAPDGDVPSIVRRDSIRIGERASRALTAPTPRTFHFYLDTVPEGASLVFDHGADVPAAFAITATADGAEPVVVWQTDVVPGQWQETEVSLSEFSGASLRLSLQTQNYDAGLAGWGEPDLMVPRRKLPPPMVGAAPARGTIMIVVDTLRADVLQPYNADSPLLTPAFDGLAADGALFENAYVNENWTKPSVATLLSGLYPSTHGAKREPDVLSDDVELLPEYLKARGFSTAAFIANGFVSGKFGFDQGWDTHLNYIRKGRNSDAENVYRDALAWIDEHKDERFFVYLQPIDPHVPYQVPRSYVDPYHPEQYSGPVGNHLGGHDQADFSGNHETLDDADYAWIRALYYGEVAYHDAELGKFVKGLRERGLLDEVVVVVTSDHGEELDDHGKLGHGHSLYEELTRVPMTVRYPSRIPAGLRVSELTESIDLAPTILDLMGVEASAVHAAQSLMPVIQGDPVQRPFYAITDFLDRKRAIRVGRWKLKASSGGKRELFDLQTDATEQNDVDLQNPIALRTVELHLYEGLANNMKYRRLEDMRTDLKFDSVEVDMDEDLKRQLEALGYFGD